MKSTVSTTKDNSSLVNKKLNKRDRQPSLDTKKNKKPRTSTETTPDSQKKKVQRNHVRSYLATASDKELDKLFEYLKKRKEKRSEPASDTEVDLNIPEADPGQETPYQEFKAPSGQTRQETTHDIQMHRKISCRDIASLEAELYPNRRRNSRKDKIKLTDR